VIYLTTAKSEPSTYWRIVTTPENGAGVFRIVGEKKRMQVNVAKYWWNHAAGAETFLKHTL